MHLSHCGDDTCTRLDFLGTRVLVLILPQFRARTLGKLVNVSEFLVLTPEVIILSHGLGEGVRMLVIIV